MRGYDHESPREGYDFLGGDWDEMRSFGGAEPRLFT